MNGKVVKTIALDGDRTAADFAEQITVDRSGWIVLRAWNDHATPDVFDLYPYASTNPVFVTVGSEPIRSREDAAFFLKWIDKVHAAAAANRDYNTQAERDAVLKHIDDARKVFEQQALGGPRHAPAFEIADDLARSVVAGKSRHAATGVRRRSAHVEPFQRPAIIAMAEHRPRAVELIEAELAVEDVAADERELSLHIERRKDHPSKYGRTEIRRIARHRVDHDIGDFFATIVPARSIGQLRRDMLAEQARDMLALRRQAVVEHALNMHLDHRLLRPAGAARVGVGLVQIFQRRRDHHAAAVMVHHAAHSAAR